MKVVLSEEGHQLVTLADRLEYRQVLRLDAAQQRAEALELRWKNMA